MEESINDRIANAEKLLNDLPDYMVLRRVKEIEPMPREIFYATMTEHKLGIILDTETTGLDLEKDDVIELGMVPFVYNAQGRIVGTLEAFSKLRDTQVPITSEITDITGIHPQDIVRKIITDEEINAFVYDATIIIAHNAEFDRPRVEKIWPIFKDKHWACSVNEIDWKKFGFEGRGLKTLLMQNGLFFDGHRAVNDCQALLALLMCEDMDPEPKTYLSILLENARKSQWRIDAVDSPYAAKDLLKARKYKWDSDLRSWWKEVTAEEGEVEVAWLESNIYKSTSDKIKITKTTTKDRFTDRSKPSLEKPHE